MRTKNTVALLSVAMAASAELSGCSAGAQQPSGPHPIVFARLQDADCTNTAAVRPLQYTDARGYNAASERAVQQAVEITRQQADPMDLANLSCTVAARTTGQPPSASDRLNAELYVQPTDDPNRFARLLGHIVVVHRDKQRLPIGNFAVLGQIDVTG